MKAFHVVSQARALCMPGKGSSSRANSPAPVLMAFSTQIFGIVLVSVNKQFLSYSKIHRGSLWTMLSVLLNRHCIRSVCYEKIGFLFTFSCVLRISILFSKSLATQRDFIVSTIMNSDLVIPIECLCCIIAVINIVLPVC